MATELTASETRHQDATFVAQCSLDGLQELLPLRWPSPADTPPCPKRSYRSYYVYLGWGELRATAAWEHLSDFDLLLRLVDFSPLRPVLAHLLGWTGARGWVPFDPISIFLLLAWQITNSWNRAETLRNLQDPRYADYAHRFGFANGVFPTEGGLRYWLTTLGQNSTSGESILVDEEQQIAVAVQRLNQLLAQSVALIVSAGFLSQEACEKALICPDGMLHHAASRMHCAWVQESCYQPTSSASPRPCPVKAKQQRGCDCDRLACASACRYATPRDPQARFVHYSGSNQSRDNTQPPADSSQPQHQRGRECYGYRSLPLQLADSTRRFSLVLLDDFLPANEREENPAAALLLQLPTFYPDLHVDAVAADAALGYDLVLHVVYAHLHARRVIDLRAHQTDGDKALWPVRGYDDQGRPICPFGYAFTANGFDFERQRHKWFCAQACRNGATPLVRVQNATYPPNECPYLAPEHPYGRILNLSERFEDGSIRLARDVPVDSPAWKQLYHRARNAVEGRNATFQRWRLKRLPVYGLPRGKALDFLADVWLNLTTMARLAREATAAATGT